MKRVMLVCALAVWGLAGWAERVATRVDLSSVPAGASVWVDGVSRGVTPLAVFDLAPGRHRMRCTLEGYENGDGFFDLVSGRPGQCSVELAPVKGLLLLTSEPAGCAVSLDGVTLGATPRLITQLNAKDTHRLTLSKAGYRPSVLDVRFSGRTPLVRHAQLVLDSAVVEVRSEPAGAEVTVNGIVRGVTPLVVGDIPKGRATVRVALSGYGEEVRELSVNAGDRQTLALALKGLPGRLALASVPDGARLYVNGSFRGRSPLSVSNLPPGSYEIRAELPGYAVETRTVVVANGATVSEEFRLRNVMGRVAVRTAPAGVQVLVDGHVAGTTVASAPDAETSNALAVENLLEGEHELVFRKDGYAEAVRRPVVANGETVDLPMVRLKRVFKPNVELLTSTGTVRGILVGNGPDAVTLEVSLGIQRSFLRSEIRKLTFIEGR